MIPDSVPNLKIYFFEGHQTIRQCHFGINICPQGSHVVGNWLWWITGGGLKCGHNPISLISKSSLSLLVINAEHSTQMAGYIYTCCTARQFGL